MPFQGPRDSLTDRDRVPAQRCGATSLFFSWLLQTQRETESLSPWKGTVPPLRDGLHDHGCTATNE